MGKGQAPRGGSPGEELASRGPSTSLQLLWMVHGPMGVYAVGGGGHTPKARAHQEQGEKKKISHRLCSVPSTEKLENTFTLIIT